MYPIVFRLLIINNGFCVAYGLKGNVIEKFSGAFVEKEKIINESTDVIMYSKVFVFNDLKEVYKVFN